MTHKITLTIAGLVVAALGLAIGLQVSTQTQTPTTTKTSASMTAQESAIAKKIELKFDGIKVIAVQQTPFNDLYEIILDKNEIVYTNAATEFIMAGSLISGTDKRNLTQERQNELNAIDFKTLPLERAFKRVKGNGSRQMALFEDPNCGYCKKFRSTLEGFDNLTVYTFVIDILGKDSTLKAQQLLCAKNPAQAWDDWMLHDKMPADVAACDTSVLNKNKALATELGITGTPTIFLQDGSRLPGAVDADELEIALAKAKP